MSAVAGDIIIELKLDDKDVSVNVKKAGATLQQFQTTLNQTARSVKRLEDAHDSLSTKFRHLVMTLGNLRFVAMDVNDIFLRLPVAILKSAGELERMQVLMKGLSKEMTEAGKVAEGMRDFKFVTGLSKNAPFEISALSDAFVKLKTAGMDPANGSMQALVDSVARFGGTGESLKRASVAIQQMSGKSVVSMEELRQQLGESVPTAMQDMADGMGVSMAKLAKIVETGTLAAGPALGKMLLQMRINNEGAAAEMMKTWTGMLSQLKSEWELTAKFIADNGFGDAAKGSVASITEMLRSDEFRRFASESGAALGDAVRGLTELVRTLIKYREEISFMAQAWLAYKVVFSGIIPMARTLDETYKGAIARMGAERSSILGKAAASRAAAIQAVTDAKYEAIARAETTAAKLALDQKELDSVRVRNAAILAEDVRLRAALNGLERRAYIPGLNDSAGRDAAIRGLGELSRKNSELTARERELARSVIDTTAAMTTANAEVAKKTAEMFKLTNATQLQRFGAIAATAATRAFGGAVSLLGGPIGIAILAISGLVMWWQKVSGAAKEAEERQRRAANFTSNVEDLEKAKEAQKEAQAAFDDAKKNFEVRRATSLSKSPTGEELDALDKASVALARAKNNVTAIQTSLNASGARELANSINDGVNRKIQALKEAGSMEIREIEQQQKKALEGMKVGSDEYVKKNKEFNDKKIAASISALSGRIKATSDAEQKAIAAAQAFAKDSPDRSGQIQAADQLRETRERLEAELAGIKKADSDLVTYEEKKKKGAGAKESPFQKEIERLAAGRAQLEAEIAGFAGIAGKANVVAGEVEKVRQMIADGKFGKLTSKEKGGLISAATKNAELEQVKKELEETAKHYQRVVDFIEGMRPDMESAAELLADPLGTSTRGRLEKRADKFIGSNLVELEAYAKKVGKTIEQVKREIANGAQGADAATLFSQVAQDTAQLNDSMVSDSREAAQARAEADNERHRQVMANIIRERAAHGASTEELARLAVIAQESNKARANKLAKDFETPMQKLASEWANTTKSMQAATAQWAQQGVDAFVNFVKTGKLEWQSLVVDILAGLLKIQMQKQLTKLLDSGGGSDGFLGGVGDFLTKLVGGGSSVPGVQDAATIAGVQGLAPGFANGGIMTSLGPMPLRKYAAGGIANSPQMAVFGEGSMNEAYVPLPDGRSIPVTMKGMLPAAQTAAPAVTVNVINQSGQQVNAQQGAPRFDGKQMILDVVLSAVTTPGSFRDGMKGAIGR